MSAGDNNYPDDFNNDDDNYTEQDGNGNEVEIYSSRAIFWFSFFSPIFGGIMLAINLRNAGYKRAALSVVLFAVGYYLLSSLVVARIMPLLDMKTNEGKLIFSGAGIVASLIGAFILSQYYYKKYFPEDNYYPRSITTPLMIAVVLILVYSLLLRSMGGVGML